ncbi:serine hydrolase domain-containing protein [Schleiferilactobacillus harbinensis]|jgi:CubicO group peptidase (beta-lactamase class C family)|uniref:serine hydrolase domain-containing protein n=1 Tax=Schleiferilactobacillus harbinensis TaxID=304207 RepID=UPI0021A92345|nr:serine hydrolase domain-containing protein [Schleiferilactobacillus harbinensis]MCT2907371.1 class A beta-lactamase-related serine hydrolase [Schleiferilactobacillus harbinensis]
MKRITAFLIGLLTGAVVVGAAGTATYYGYVRPRHLAEVKREAEKDAADRSSLSLRVSDLTKDLQAADKKLPVQPGQTSVNKLSETAEAQLTKKLQAEQFVGTVLLVRNGTIIYHQGIGYADAAKKRLNTVKSIYQIGSTQKSLTAIALAQLIQAGKVHYGDNIHQYYSQIPASHNITIREMLNMRSGLIYTLGAPKTVLTDDQVIQRSLDNLTYDADFHGKQNYQAVNFVLLAGIIEKISGQSYEQYITQHLFQPLQLTNTQAGFAWNFAQQPNRTVSYVAKDGIGTYDKTITENLADMRGELGTGNIYTTPYALYRLERAIIQGKYTSTAAVAELRDTTDGQYGGGVYNFPTYVYSHGVKNYQELVFTMSDDGNTAAILMTNRAYDYNNALPRAKWYYHFAQTAELATEVTKS